MPRDTDLEFKSGFSSPGFAPAPRGPSLSATLTDAQVAAMYGPQKFAAALEIAVGMVPGRTAESVKAMMPPIPVLAGGLAAWAAGHFFGPSWLMDAALVLGLGVQGVQASWYLLRAGLILRSNPAFELLVEHVPVMLPDAAHIQELLDRFEAEGMSARKLA